MVVYRDAAACRAVSVMRRPRHEGQNPRFFAAVRGSFHAAGLLMIFAYLADLFDGVLARRMKGRSAELGKIGARLDSLADQVGGGVVPGVVLLAYANWQPWLLFAAIALLGAASIRLAYFDVHGLDSIGTYAGLPTDNVILFFAMLLLLEGVLPPALFTGMLLVSVMIAAALMVSPLRVPKSSGSRMALISAFAIAVGVAHAVLLH